MDTNEAKNTDMKNRDAVSVGKTIINKPVKKRELTSTEKRYKSLTTVAPLASKIGG